MRYYRGNDWLTYMVHRLSDEEHGTDMVHRLSDEEHGLDMVHRLSDEEHVLHWMDSKDVKSV